MNQTRRRSSLRRSCLSIFFLTSPQIFLFGMPLIAPSFACAQESTTSTPAEKPPSTPRARRFPNHFSLSGVRKWLEKDWAPADHQDGLGFTADFGPATWPIKMAFLFSSTTRQATPALPGITRRGPTETQEYAFGIRKYLALNRRVQPFGGVGVAKILAYSGETGIRPGELRDSGVGPWLEGGIILGLAPALHVGLTAHYSSTSVTLAGHDLDPGGTYLAVFVGVCKQKEAWTGCLR